MRIPNSISFPINEKSLKPMIAVENFERLIDRTLEEKAYVGEYLCLLREKSMVTYNHSVNTALQMYAYWEMRSEFPRVKEMVEKYSIAALLHDVGKLTTPDYILHSKENFRDLPFEEGNRRMAIMNRHSIDGLSIAKKFGFSKEETGVSIAHHVDDSVLKAAPKNRFVGADQSRDSWPQQYGDGTVADLLWRELGWVTPEDIKMIVEVSFFDVVEALRATDRAYSGCKALEWEAPTFGLSQSVYSIARMNVACQKMDRSFLARIESEEFRRNFDFFENCGEPTRIGEMLNDRVIQYDYIDDDKHILDR